MAAEGMGSISDRSWKQDFSTLRINKSILISLRLQFFSLFITVYFHLDHIDMVIFIFKLISEGESAEIEQNVAAFYYTTKKEISY
ncbi:MAG: hypothetical protein ACETWK_01280 [Candidatus Aminicenantaceae bacterium]